MTSKDTPKSTSSPEQASGRLPPAGQAGPMLDLFGAPPAPAKARASQESGKEPMIQGICGRTYIGSSVLPASEGTDRLCLWESKLRQRLARIGSTESALIWRTKATPHGRVISRLAPSTLHTNGNDSGGSHWRSPTAGERRGGAYQDPEKALASLASGHTINLEDQMVVENRYAMWPTPKASAAGETSRSGDRKDEPLMGGLMRGAAGLWPTPTSLSFKDSHQPGNSAGMNKTVALTKGTPMDRTETAMWVTPSARDGKDSAGMSTAGENQDGDQIAIPGMEKNRQRLDQLPRQMIATTAATEAGGPTPSLSPATTAKRGAPNPLFPCWLMGWPEELVSGVLRAIQSIRSSRPKSSRRSSTRSRR